MVEETPKTEVKVETNSLTENQRKMLIEKGHELKAQIEKGEWNVHQMLYIMSTYLREKDPVFVEVENKFKQGLLDEVNTMIERAKTAMIVNAKVVEPTFKDGKPTAPT